MCDITLIVPVLNEKQFLNSLIESIIETDDLEKQIIFVDGGSTDGTYEKLVQIKSENPGIEVIKNEGRYVSQGFNKAFPFAKGSYIALIGAHTIYPKGYFQECVAEIKKGACDVAGGRLFQTGHSRTGKAISLCMSSKFGVGNTAFRTENKRMYVDSVAFAVYSKEVFERVGLLDEELHRNQDDEFHYRINAAKMRILMLPELQPVYHVRETIRGVFRQYFQYGLYKPLVLLKVHAGFRPRHIVPPLFVLYLLLIVPLAHWLPMFLLPLASYLSIAIALSLSKKVPFSVKIRMPFLFSVLHVAYGLGFIFGIPKLLFIKKRI